MEYYDDVAAPRPPSPYIMADPELISLIDEFYFEHHVTGSPMMFHGWGRTMKQSVGVPLGDIVDSYDVFTFLRDKVGRCRLTL